MGGGKLTSAAGRNYLVGDGGGRDIIFIRDDSTILQGRAMSQTRNWRPTELIGNCSLYRARRNRNGRHKKRTLRNKRLGLSRTRRFQTGAVELRDHLI